MRFTWYILYVPSVMVCIEVPGNDIHDQNLQKEFCHPSYDIHDIRPPRFLLHTLAENHMWSLRVQGLVLRVLKYGRSNAETGVLDLQPYQAP